MKIAVVDDLAACRAQVCACLRRYLAQRYAGEAPVVDEFSSGEALLERFAPAAYDLIFLDQFMEGLSGLDTARRIRARDNLVPLVFVTTSRDHAIDSYGVRACGYLVKPFADEDFARTMEAAGLARIRAARFIRLDREKLLLRDILYCDQDDHYVQLHTGGRGLLRLRLPFAELTRTLSPYPQFLNCYRCCIVNLDRVERMDSLSFVMDTGERVPFSQRDRKKIEALYHDYLFAREREEELL